MFEHVYVHVGQNRVATYTATMDIYFRKRRIWSKTQLLIQERRLVQKKMFTSYLPPRKQTVFVEKEKKRKVSCYLPIIERGNISCSHRYAIVQADLSHEVLDKIFNPLEEKILNWYKSYITGLDHAPI